MQDQQGGFRDGYEAPKAGTKPEDKSQWDRLRPAAYTSHEWGCVSGHEGGIYSFLMPGRPNIWLGLWDGVTISTLQISCFIITYRR